ncbi:MAG: hypothetical protein ACRDSM_25660, partial [Pseudonocardiaceae bacterium]
PLRQETRAGPGLPHHRCGHHKTSPHRSTSLQPKSPRFEGIDSRSDTLFSDDATTLIHQTSRGYPRAINNLALQALVAAFATSKTIVDETSTRTAITEVTTE